MPNRGIFIGDDTDTSFIDSGQDFSLNVPGTQDVPNLNTLVFPLTNDFRISDDDFQQQGVRSLADIVGHDWFLKRIVGSIVVARRVTTLAAQPLGGGPTSVETVTLDELPACKVGCGFFVGRANDQSSGGGADTPIGSASVQELNDNYSPLELDTVRYPWIWRRTWILGCQGGRSYTPAGQVRSNSWNFPQSNTQYGSVADGPKIDQRTKRRLKEGDRLWFAVSVHGFNAGMIDSVGPYHTVIGHLDYRLFGSLMRPRNRGTW